MKGIIALAALLTIGLAQRAPAQEAADSTVRTAPETSAPRGTYPDSALSTAELEEALGQLATTLQALAERVANDPELRASALQAAEGAVEIAQVVVAEQSNVILDALRAAAETLSAIQVPEQPDPAVRRR